MRRSQPRISVIAVSRKALLARVALLLLLAASLALFLLARSNNVFLERAKLAFSDVVTPVMAAIAAPADAMHAASAWIQETASLRFENRRLKQENLKLKQWQAVAAELGNENAKLRQLMNFAPAGKQSYISARVALSSQSVFGRSVVVNAGTEAGVENDLAVIDDNGFVGRVLETGGKTSRVLLVTDMSSRIPVMSENSRERAIAAGSNSGALQLLYLPENSTVKEGERIVTTSDGGVLPPGLPVGVVTHVEKGTATVRPFMDRGRLEYVSIVDFSM